MTQTSRSYRQRALEHGLRERLADRRWFPTLTVLDLYTRESLALADRSLTGIKVATALSHVLRDA